MNRATLFVVATMLLIGFTMTACGDDNGDDEEPTVTEPAGDDGATPAGTATPAGNDATPAGDDTTPEGMETPTTDDATPAGEATASTEAATPDEAGTPTGDDATPADETGAATGTDDGMAFTAFDAGAVELAREGNILRLIEVRPNEGWNYRVDDDDDDGEIEVDFRRENHEVDFDAEIEGGRLKIEITDDRDDTEPGTFVVGEAGEVEIARDGNTLSLIEVRTNEGWDYTEREEGDEIEVEFRRDSEKAEFEAEIDDGRLNVDISIKFYVED